MLGAAVVILALVGAWALGGRPLNSNVTATPAVSATQAGRTASTQTSGRSTTKTTTATATRPASTDPASGLTWVDLAALPAQVADTLAEIEAGPPYPYPDNDGVVYHNYNKVLPTRADGYYHEFTVKTPGSSDRGARRVITGGANLGRSTGEYYYTGDHYDSFVRIRR